MEVCDNFFSKPGREMESVIANAANQPVCSGIADQNVIKLVSRGVDCACASKREAGESGEKIIQR